MVGFSKPLGWLVSLAPNVCRSCANRLPFASLFLIWLNLKNHYSFPVLLFPKSSICGVLAGSQFSRKWFTASLMRFTLARSRRIFEVFRLVFWMNDMAEFSTSHRFYIQFIQNDFTQLGDTHHHWAASSSYLFPKNTLKSYFGIENGTIYEGLSASLEF